jgi:hypothetical protein
MYALGFFSKHTTEKACWSASRRLCRALVCGKLHRHRLAWYCAIGGGVNMLVGWLASLLMTGRQAEWHPLR